MVGQTSENGKVEKKYEDGKVEVVFKNGAVRETFPNGYVIVNYTIGDIKQTLPDSSIIYYYSDQDTTQITLPTEGLNVGARDADLPLQQQPGRVPPRRRHERDQVRGWNGKVHLP